MLCQEDLAAISGIGETREELMAAITALYSEEKEQLGVLALAVELVQQQSPAAPG
jgi:ASC-1-like (ASCH) protein